MLTSASDSLLLRIRLSPNASRDVIEGRVIAGDDQDYLSVRVRAVPDRGKANKALIALLARQFKMAKCDIKLIRGETSRLKTLKLSANTETQIHIMDFMETLKDER